MELNTSLIPTDVLFLIFMEDLLQYNISLKFENHVIESSKEHWKIPIFTSVDTYKYFVRAQ